MPIDEITGLNYQFSFQLVGLSQICSNCGRYFKRIRGKQKFCQKGCRWNYNNRKDIRMVKKGTNGSSEIARATECVFCAKKFI